MDKKKLGVTIATVGGIGIFVFFIFFTVGGFLSVRYMRFSPVTIVGIVGFVISMFALVIGSLFRSSGDIKQITSNDSMQQMIQAGKDIKDAISSINKTTCSYCGTVYNSKESKCPNCGSANKKQ